MKTSLITIILFLASINLKAQHYTFDASTSSYEDLDHSTSLNDTMTWQNPHY
ncbi:MAG: hypothetical protein P8I31_03575 [Bacteroidia bacterium]|nr:hypothetical protein [Bacteroidia bacterium]